MSKSPTVHDDSVKAQNEAIRLAKLYSGMEFFVLQVIGSTKQTTNVTFS